MMICGVDLKGSEALFALIEVSGDQITPCACEIRKIKFGESSEQSSAQHFYDTICGFIRDHGITHIAIKQRATRGKFAGGSVTFKMEGLFQLNPHVETHLFSVQAIAASRRRNSYKLPADLKKYQQEAFHVAYCAKAFAKS